MNDGHIIMARRILEVEEGFESKPYIDTEGYPTVGYGLKIGYKMQPLEDYKAFPAMPVEVARFWLERLIQEVDRDLQGSRAIAPAYDACCIVRKAVLISMAYQMGRYGLSQFTNTLAAIEEQEWELAAFNMLDSRWARQTAVRAARHAEMMEQGALDGYYLSELS